MLAAEAPAAVQWLQEMGVRFDFLPNYFIAQSTTRMAPVGGGLALLDALFARAETFGTQLTTLLETTARALRFDDGKVAGVTAVDADHTVINIDAGAVVLASGGFEGNPEMLARYIGRWRPTRARSHAAVNITAARASRWRSTRARRRVETSAVSTHNR